MAKIIFVDPFAPRTETPWQQFDRLAYTTCVCGHLFKQHEGEERGQCLGDSDCDCDDAEPAQ